MDGHLAGLSPQLIATIRKAAAAHAANAPPLNADQLKKLSAIFQPTGSRREAA